MMQNKKWGVIIMADDNYRVDRLEKDVSKLQEKAENNSVIINKMDKDNGKAEIYQAQIMANLASITFSVAKTLDKATQTEILAFNLKTVTDKQTVDINNIGADLKDTKNAAYNVTLYGLTFKDDSPRHAEMYQNLSQRLEAYKYKKSVENFDDEVLAYIDVYKGMIDV